MTKEQLKILAVGQTMFKPSNLPEAFNRLGFVQADPIRSPARAEELVLRHRVKNYRVGDLDRNYGKLGIEEDFLYAHGFMTNEVWRLLHPRQMVALEGLHKEVHAFIKDVGVVNSNDLATHFGKIKVTNWWGGSSQATRMALEELHYEGYVRIVGRTKGVRLYQYFEPEPTGLTVEQRLAALVLKIVAILGPVQLTTLNQSLYRTRRLFGPTGPVVNSLINQGLLLQHKIDGADYVWLDQPDVIIEESKGVKFLAPFDPVVWDRKRFEHLWGWPYRFEAYTPAAKRIRGYYAMPLLYGHEVIGWVNVLKDKEGLRVEDGYVGRRPTSKAYQQEFDREVARLRGFLGLEI